MQDFSKKGRRIIAFIFFVLFSVVGQAQVFVDDTLTPEEIVQNVLLGNGVAVSNITFNGQPGSVMNNQIGRYYGTSAVVDFPEAVVMGSGLVLSVVDELIWDPLTNPVSQDPDLVAISNQNINDGAILEFDFIPNGDSLEFRYVFS